MLLRKEDGKMCCLGFVAVANGAPKDIILERHTLADVPYYLPMLVDDIGGTEDDSEIANSLMLANDRTSLADEMREAQIINLGKEVDIEFSFVN